MKTELIDFMTDPKNTWIMREQGVLATMSMVKMMTGQPAYSAVRERLEQVLTMKKDIIKACKKQDEELFNKLNDEMNTAFRTAAQQLVEK
jgi:hypothetical protein